MFLSALILLRLRCTKMYLRRKIGVGKMGKMGACIALSAAMMLTSVGSMLPSDWGIETVYADERQTTPSVRVS